MKFACRLFILLLSVFQISFAGELIQRHNSSFSNNSIESAKSENSSLAILNNAHTEKQQITDSDREKVNQLEGQIKTLKIKLNNNNWATMGLCGILIFANFTLLYIFQSQLETQFSLPYNDPRNAGNKTQCLEYIVKTIIPLCDNPFNK